MDNFLPYLKDQFQKPQTRFLIVIGSALILISAILGISDNPTGIGLVYLGLILLAFSMVHHWEKAGDFGTLLAVSVISIPVMALIHNIFDTINDKIGSIPVVDQLLGGIAVISFILAVFVAPAVVIVSIFGGVYRLIRK